MEKKLRYVWWVILCILLVAAGKRWLLPPAGTDVEQNSANKEIVVYVTGAVAKPGLYTLPSNARLDHALREAEVLPEANIEVLNLAEKLKDGQKITIPYRLDVAASQGETSQLVATQPLAQTSGQGLSQPQGQQTYSQVNSGLAATSAPLSAIDSLGRVNINIAGVNELDQLPGIGPVIAQRIVDYRNEHGYFLSPEDIQKVSGIGPKTYEKLASKITVGP